MGRIAWGCYNVPAMADAEFLTTVPIFSNLNPEQLLPLIGKLHRRRYQRGEVIFHQDDPADRLHIIVQGKVRISIASEDGREKDIALLQQGECFGEMALLDGSPRSATASAMEALETLTLFREDFLEFRDKHPEVAVDTTGLLTRRLRSVNQMLGDLAFLDVPTRVAKQLLEMAETSAGDAEWQGPIELTLGQEELARLVGASRETVSRVLNGYRRQGILLTSHRRITIKDRPALERMAYV